MTLETDPAAPPNAPLGLPEMDGPGKDRGVWAMVLGVLSSWPARISAVVLALIVLMAVFAPLLGTSDPVTINPA